jgi:hypothetical protein
MYISAETHRNSPKRPKHPEILLEVEWGVSRTGLHTGTRFSIRSGRNGTEYTTMGSPGGLNNFSCI